MNKYIFVPLYTVFLIIPWQFSFAWQMQGTLAGVGILSAVDLLIRRQRRQV